MQTERAAIIFFQKVDQMYQMELINEQDFVTAVALIDGTYVINF